MDDCVSLKVCQYHINIQVFYVCEGVFFSQLHDVDNPLLKRCNIVVAVAITAAL